MVFVAVRETCHTSALLVAVFMDVARYLASYERKKLQIFSSIWSVDCYFTWAQWAQHQNCLSEQMWDVSGYSEVWNQLNLSKKKLDFTSFDWKYVALLSATVSFLILWLGWARVRTFPNLHIVASSFNLMLCGDLRLGFVVIWTSMCHYVELTWFCTWWSVHVGFIIPLIFERKRWRSYT